MVNNKPEEKVKVSDNGGWVSGSRNLCDDMWESDNDESTCGFDRDANGNKIWDSQVCIHINNNNNNKICIRSVFFALVT